MLEQEGDFEDDGTLASEGYASDTFIALAFTGNPSIITNGELSAEIEPVPRTRIEGAPQCGYRYAGRTFGGLSHR